MNRRDYAAAVLVIVAVFVMRSPALVHTVADHDEALYVLVARELLHGHLPYVTAWECKPPFFFAMLAGFFRVFGVSISSLRILSDVAVSATALEIYGIALLATRGNRLAGITAAITYASLACSDSGVAGEAEIFFAPFVVGAMLLVLRSFTSREPVRVGVVFSIGVLAGLATQVKESAIPEVAFVLVLGIVICRLALPRILLLLAGAVMPVLLGVLPYLASHQVAAYLDANVWTLIRRATGPLLKPQPWSTVLRQQIEAFFPSIPLALLVPLAWKSTSISERRMLGIMSIWFVLDILSVVPAREFLGYQFIPAMVPAAVLGVLVLFELVNERLRPRVMYAAMFVTVLAHLAGQATIALNVLAHRASTHDATYGDDTAKLAEFLQQHRPQTAMPWLYVASDEEALYVLTDAPLPTRYVFSEHLTLPEQMRVAGVQGTSEIDRIFSARPLYVVFDSDAQGLDQRATGTIERNLRDHYQPVFAIGDRTIYRYRATAVGLAPAKISSSVSGSRGGGENFK